MFNKETKYTLEELLNQYNMYNIGFTYFGNKENGELELYLRTGNDKLSIFKSSNNQTKMDYLKSNEEKAKKVKFVFDREVEELELDIQVYVIRTSDINIPCARYTLRSLNKLIKEQDSKNRENSKDGIAYMIVDNNIACNLYDGVYLFSKENNGFINDLRNKYSEENNSLLKNNLKMILDYYDSLKDEKSW